MRAEERRDEPKAGALGQPRDQAQEAKLALGRQGVPRLHLDRSGPPAFHPAKARGGRGEQLSIGGGPGRSDGRVDPSTRLGDLGVARPPDLERELERPLASEKDVGVGVHEPGDHDSPFRRDPASPGAKSYGSGEVAFASDPREAPLSDGERGIPYRPEFLGGLPDAGHRPAGEGRELRDLRDDQVGADHGWWMRWSTKSRAAMEPGNRILASDSSGSSSL